MAHNPDSPLERLAGSIEQLAGSIERVTFHAQESGFCVLQVKVRGQRDLVADQAIAIGYAIEHSRWPDERRHL